MTMERDAVYIAAGCASAILVWIVAHIVMGTHIGEVTSFLVTVVARTFLGFVSGALLAVLITAYIDRRRRR